jgi:hypothetical protein
LKITKSVFGFKGEAKVFFALIWIARPGRYGRAGRGALTALPFAVSYCGPAHGEVQLLLLLSPRAFSACERFSNAARSAAMAWSKNPARFDGFPLSRHEARPVTLQAGSAGSR